MMRAPFSRRFFLTGVLAAAALAPGAARAELPRLDPAERGLMTRNSDPNDRRRLTLCLTDAGREAVLASTHKALAVSRETLSPLSPKERDALLKLLQRLT